MSRIRIREESELPWMLTRSLVKPEDLERYSDGELNSKVRLREVGTENSPQLFEVEFEADSEIKIHAHEEDEIIFILAGQMQVGNRVLGAGASVFIKGNTLYGFKVGHQGLTFLNFRPRLDTTFVTRDEFLERHGK
jgi:quercetin dioxygenase-like cupin family protein